MINIIPNTANKVIPNTTQPLAHTSPFKCAYQTHAGAGENFSDFLTAADTGVSLTGA